MRRSWSALLPLVLIAGAPLAAQAPDCTGISGVFNSDPDLIGELTTVRVAQGLVVPVFVASPPGDLERLFIVERGGRIKLLKNGTLLPTPFLDIDPIIWSGGERGLLGLAFHPDYESNGYLFVYYTAEADPPDLDGGEIVVARYKRDGSNDDLADPGSAETVIVVDRDPFQGNHNGGMIAFSPIDGKLYMGTGDGGSFCDPGPGLGNAQSLTSNLGKMLRLGVDSLPYSTAGNPYDGFVFGNDEIWSYGLRNPWRWSFDRETGAIYIGDVGQGVWEEVNCASGSSTGGENYGWLPYEGDHCPNPSCGEIDAGDCGIASYLAPIEEYDQAGAPCAIIGGYVYRGCRMDDLHGTYFYSDNCDDFVNTFSTDSTCMNDLPRPNREDDLEPDLPNQGSIGSISSFGEDARGELYIVDLGGEVFKILPDLDIMEVSGPGAVPFILDGGGDWSWEDFEAITAYPIEAYKVFRSDAPTGPFNCEHESASNSWVGGDPQVPLSGQAFYYLVVGENEIGKRSVAGADSGGNLRTVNAGSGC